jgi:hypothetical protein
MKRLVLFSAVLGVFIFSVCTTKYFHKTDTKNGICEESLYTTNSNIAGQITLGNKNGCNPCDNSKNSCNKKTPSTKIVNKKSEPLNVNIIVK